MQTQIANRVVLLLQVLPLQLAAQNMAQPCNIVQPAQSHVGWQFARSLSFWEVGSWNGE